MWHDNDTCRDAITALIGLMDDAPEAVVVRCDCRAVENVAPIPFLLFVFCSACHDQDLHDMEPDFFIITQDVYERAVAWARLHYSSTPPYIARALLSILETERYQTLLDKEEEEAEAEAENAP